MVLTIPDSLKSIAPYIRRAEELEKDINSPSANDYKIISFYCKKYALELAIKLKINTPEVNDFLNTLIVMLEKEKLTLQATKEQSAVICENFAHSVFNRADDEDRNSIPTKITAKIYYSAITFFEILEQFGELDNEIKEKLKYSKWRTTDILGAIKEGRQPTPGGFQDSNNIQNSTIVAPPLSSNVNDIIQNNSNSPQPNVSSENVIQSFSTTSYPTVPTSNNLPNNSYPSLPPNNSNFIESSYNSIKSIITPSAPPVSQPPIMNRPPPSNNNDPRVKDAIEVCNFAIAALKHNEITLAKERLNEALRRLNAL